MATTIAGPVRMPDGTIPTHGRVIFRPRLGGYVGSPAVTAGAVVAAISSAGAISVVLEGRADGTPYAVVVEHWSVADQRMVSTPLPDVVPTGAAGPFTLADLAAVDVPRCATNENTWKRGDTISIAGQWIDHHRRPLDLTGYAIAAAMRGPDNVTRDMLVTVTAAATGLLSIGMSAAETALLPLGDHLIDVKARIGARVARTQTGIIHIAEEVTP